MDLVEGAGGVLAGLTSFFTQFNEIYKLENPLQFPYLVILLLERLLVYQIRKLILQLPYVHRGLALRMLLPQLRHDLVQVEVGNYRCMLLIA